jgi:hypothetical protein
MTRMTSKIARFASDFAQNLSIFSKLNSISPKSLDLVAVRPQSRSFFCLASQNTNKNATNTVFKYITMVTREKHCLNANKTLTVRTLENT